MPHETEDQGVTKLAVLQAPHCGTPGAFVQRTLNGTAGHPRLHAKSAKNQKDREEIRHHRCRVRCAESDERQGLWIRRQLAFTKSGTASAAPRPYPTLQSAGMGPAMVAYALIDPLLQ